MPKGRMSISHQQQPGRDSRDEPSSAQCHMCMRCQLDAQQPRQMARAYNARDPCTRNLHPQALLIRPSQAFLQPHLLPTRGGSGDQYSSTSEHRQEDLVQFRRSSTMEALRGVRTLRSAAARAAQLQPRRQVSTQPAKYLKENADTTKLSADEAAKLGAAKQPPGSDKGPGTFMHQQSNLDTKNNRFLQPWLFPIYPMVGMVAIGVGLAVMTAYRQVAVNPGVLLDKSKRTEELPELQDKEWALKMSRRYAEDSPLRHLSTEHKVSPFGRHLDEDVKDGPAIQIGRKAMELSGERPGLPGDDKPVHGPSGPAKPLGGNN